MRDDRRFLIGVVAQELGIQIREDDPVFACVLLNRWSLHTLLDEGMERLKPSFTAHENELSEMMKRSLQEFSRMEEIMRVTYGKMRKVLRAFGLFLGIFVLAVISLGSAVAIVYNMPPGLSANDMRSLQLGRSVEAQWTSLDQKSRDLIQASIKKKN